MKYKVGDIVKVDGGVAIITEIYDYKQPFKKRTLYLVDPPKLGGLRNAYESNELSNPTDAEILEARLKGLI